MSGVDDHAKLMDQVYRFTRHVYDPTRKYFLFGRDKLIEDLAVPDGGHVLELGCGTGRNLIKAAERYPNARFYGVDISQAMLEVAEKSAGKRPHLKDKIRFAAADATSFSPGELFGQDHFDRIFFSFSLSMIPVWREALDHAITLLAPNGQLHVVDFGDHGSYPAAFRKAFGSFLQSFHVEPRLTLPQTLDAIASAHENKTGATTVATTQYILGRYSILGKVCAGAAQETDYKTAA